jgi:hypothetical protein
LDLARVAERQRGNALTHRHRLFCRLEAGPAFLSSLTLTKKSQAKGKRPY